MLRFIFIVHVCSMLVLLVCLAGYLDTLKRPAISLGKCGVGYDLTDTR